ncbi:hypothetical protein DICSQDRAFT_147842 [Dichomitus squalens LYAD-421 SS1]|uniref:Uncharacterized protein n=1 Tax=Dichomitus squalens (strain LYAD-421) TaxID=732165 RepID=R7SWB4_DICSQ|nr:uncharacterized protein DICSQDRAFT_147842 [Dichomitus squalens LYAD-421 SS1]EJF60371.1 hypothetical protein DICSQDRAFT_147842 [Dichomitus squalens LYAD-421 SS1]
MALVCRHDVVLFLVNIDTAGEQQKYGVALVDHLFTLLPEKATVVIYYDIGCVLDQSLRRFDILPDSMMSRLLFATSVMHAYGHQWACQLVYNPRLRVGLGLTEGEGTERIWSKFRKLIGVTRSSARNRPVRENLSGWIRSRLKNGIDARAKAAEKDLCKIQVPVTELREQWSQQQVAQLSVRAHAPSRLKRKLDAVLNLQTELNAIDSYFQHVQKAISQESDNPEVFHFLDSLRRTHEKTLSKVEGLYTLLNVAGSFPEIQGLPLEFVRTLLLARDLKMNIRTKLHQQTRKAISKRTPALMTAIRKFNKYRAELAKLHDPAWNFPLPNSLPEELNAPRDDVGLLTDVWVTRVSPTVPRWLDDTDIRTGIRAVLAKDRCEEEHRTLEMEANNLCRTYGLNLAAVELAIRLPASMYMYLLRY